MINVNKAFVDSYFKNAKRHVFFKDAIKINQHLSFHIDGFENSTNSAISKENPYFNILIGERRPNENPEILEYRKKIYLSKTTQPCFKVINSLKKIVKSQDWKIDYEKTDAPSVTKSESLQDYCEKDYPVFGSLENWIYTYGLQYMLTDPNSLVYVEPTEWDVETGEKWKPVAKFVCSDKVFDYKDGEYAVFETDRMTTITIKDVKHERPINCVMTKDAIIDLIPTDLENNFKIEVKYQHNLNKLFCFKSGGIYKKYSQGKALYVSFINPMISGLDAVAREVSDLDAEVVQHIYSTMWYISGSDCGNCRGTGRMNRYGEDVVCPKCEGEGRMLKSPYKDIVVKPKMGEGNAPTPPAGYVQKQTEIVKLQDDRIANHIYDALGSLNMEFLSQAPLNQSGTAKEVDRDELNNYVYGVAYHLVKNVMLPIYRMIADLRYGVLVPSSDARDKMIPSVGVPEKYDLLSTNSLVDNYKKAKESNLDQNIINEIENDIVNKVFSNEPDTRRKLMLIKSLDPLRGLSMEDKTSMLMVQAITKDDLVISNYITQFVSEALESDPEFWKKEKSIQQGIIYGYAVEKGLVEPKDKNLKGDEIATPTDVEAEAKAKLKGTVGGVDAIIRINESVAANTMTEASAEMLIMEIFGFSKDIASKLIEKTGDTTPPKEVIEVVE